MDIRKTLFKKPVVLSPLGCLFLITVETHMQEPWLFEVWQNSFLYVFWVVIGNLG